MPSPPRIILPKSVVFITTRTEQGLPFVCHAYMELVLWGILARAQHLYPVKVCHFIFMGNHLHFLLLAEEPTDVVNFINRIKTETSHAVNRFLGNQGRRTVWCDSYDCVPVLTIEDVLNKISYIYTNPAQSHLVESIEEYPGVSSWEMYKAGKVSKDAKWINRSRIQRSVKNMQPWERDAYARELEDKSLESHTFVLSPDAWKEAFNYKGEVKLEIEKRVQLAEKLLKEEREKNKQSVVGRKSLKAQKIDRPFSPKKFGRRMWCICRDVEKRVKFISYIKSLRRKAKEVVARWNRGDFSVQYPLGLFAPKPQAYANRLPDYPAAMVWV
jgi:REP element-mobilizing transposase RayT